ncbi:MAG: hypothetical protein ACRD8O_22275 [Bryobacteraceae bacterium]
MVLSYQREKLDAALATAEKNKELPAAGPLIQDGERLPPSVTRVFRKGQDLYVYSRRRKNATDGGHRDLLPRQGEDVRNRAAANRGRAERQIVSSAG